MLFKTQIEKYVGHWLAEGRGAQSWLIHWDTIKTESIVYTHNKKIMNTVNLGITSVTGVIVSFFVPLMRRQLSFV